MLDYLHSETFEEIIWNPLIVQVVLKMQYLALLGLECDVSLQLSSELEGGARIEIQSRIRRR